MLSGVLGHQLQLPSPACPCPCPHPRGPMVSHSAYSLVLSGGPAPTCVPNCEPHTAPLRLIPALKCLLSPDRTTQPSPQNAHTILWMHWASFCAQLEFRLSLWDPGRHLLRDGPKHWQDQEILIPVQERICRVWLYLLHSAVLILLSLCLSAMLCSALPFHPPEHRFIGGCASPWVTEFPFWTPSKWYLWQDLSYLTYMVCL